MTAVPPHSETNTATSARPSALRLALTMIIAPLLGAALLLGAIDLTIRATTDRTRHGRYTVRSGLAFVRTPPDHFEMPRDWSAVGLALPVTDNGIGPERTGPGLRIVAVGSSVGFFRGPSWERDPNLNTVCERGLQAAGLAGAQVVNHCGAGRLCFGAMASTLLGYSRYYEPDAILVEVLAGGNLGAENMGDEPDPAPDEGIVRAAGYVARYVEDARQTASAYAEVAPASGFDAGRRVDERGSDVPLEVARARLDASLSRRGLERLVPARDRSVEPGTFGFTAYLEVEAIRLQYCRRDPYPAAVRAKNLALLRSMAAYAKERDAPIAIVIVPDEVQVSPKLFDEVTRYLGEDRSSFDLDRPQRLYAEMAAEAGIQCFDLTPRLRAEPDPEALYVPRDSHLNERGNRVVGEELARVLLSSGFLDRWRPR